jgi:hypothetical protein
MPAMMQHRSAIEAALDVERLAASLAYAQGGTSAEWFKIIARELRTSPLLRQEALARMYDVALIGCCDLTFDGWLRAVELRWW